MRRFRSVSAIAAIAASTLVATAACSGGGEDDDAPKGSTKAFNYRAILAEDIATDNFWAYYNNADIYSAFVLGETRCSMFQTEFPSPSFVPNLATKDFSEFVPKENADGTSSVDVTMQDGVTWSDGKPLTADDFAFTFDTVKSLKLTDNWAGAWYPVDKDDDNIGVMKVEAVDPTTVRFTFNHKPGLAVWPFSVGEAPIMAKHHWQDDVEAAKKTADPAKTLTAESGKGDPSCGEMVYSDREKGSFVTSTANKKWHQKGRKVTHYALGGAKVVHKSEGLNGVYGGEGKGKVLTTYTVGPYAKKKTFKIFSEPNAAVLGMKNNEADFFINSLGLEKGLRQQVSSAKNLAMTSNQENGLRYLAFDERKAPMKDVAFRQAIGTLIDKKQLTEEILGGEAYPLPTALPPGNTAWYDKDKAEQLTARYQDVGNHAARVKKATEILKKAGYKWAKEPRVSGDTVTPGTGLTMPDGKKMPSIELQHPTQGYDRLRYVAAKTIVKWASDVGIPLQSKPTDFQKMITNVDSPTTRPAMWILGYSLGSPVFPDHFDTWWRSGAETNQVSYSSKEYDKAVGRFMNAPDLETAKQILWDEVVPIYQRDLPWVTLFESPAVDVYNKETVVYPYTTSLSGLQYAGNNVTALVRSAD